MFILKVVIMAGGTGTRFWPLSVNEKPKQFLSLINKKTMLQQTYNRFRKWLPEEKIYIVTSEEYATLVKEQLAIPHKQLILEPLQRDTGPCVTLTALTFLKENDNEVFAAVPSDHYFPEDDSIFELFKLAETTAKSDLSIVTLGIKPDRPETGYGYIQAEQNRDYMGQVLRVKKFIEKPCKQKAEELLKAEDVYWNSGIFIWKPSTIAYYMKQHQLQIYESITRFLNGSVYEYSNLPKVSVDYAIIEKAETIFTIPANIHWDDVGNWTALERLLKKDDEINVLQGNIHVLSTENCIIKSEDKKTIVIGAEDLIIASTKDGLLVCHKSMEQNIKTILKEIEDANG
ncbi:mannose-1-phosphate guanylyltransferase [Cytobacillus oceanisediminis]|uniref:mannose-1-phosphate guanylyltransferase n=1 Tax=Cytobacillus oceanisediminis TaxID=665099 RepID=UPI0037365AB0